MSGGLAFFWDLLFPAICIRCGALLDGSPSPRLLPAGWPPETRAFLDTDFFHPLPLDLSIPARILCPPCWFSMIPAPPAFLPEPGGPTGLVSPFYTNDTLLQVVRFMKFSGGKTAVPSLAWWMTQALSAWRGKNNNFFRGEPVVLPVPLHRSRRRERGYNQAALLARVIAERSGIEFAGGALRRIKRTRPQSNLCGGRRLENVRDAFRAADPGVIQGRDVVLVDDLITTGETVRSCVREIRNHSPLSVLALAAGRARELD
ncbi:MAG: ComF family protein, partial [Candidatus Krumholzibacteriota bacterium]|nr:ComF family protein [Candidatus Krumholzibacteriota bacterium]